MARNDEYEMGSEAGRFLRRAQFNYFEWLRKFRSVLQIVILNLSKVILVSSTSAIFKRIHFHHNVQVFDSNRVTTSTSTSSWYYQCVGDVRPRAFQKGLGDGRRVGGTLWRAPRVPCFVVSVWWILFGCVIHTDANVRVLFVMMRRKELMYRVCQITNVIIIPHFFLYFSFCCDTMLYTYRPQASKLLENHQSDEWWYHCRYFRNWRYAGLSARWERNEMEFARHSGGKRHFGGLYPKGRSAQSKGGFQQESNWMARWKCVDHQVDCDCRQQDSNVVISILRMYVLLIYHVGREY